MADMDASAPSTEPPPPGDLFIPGVVPSLIPASPVRTHRSKKPTCLTCGFVFVDAAALADHRCIDSALISGIGNRKCATATRLPQRTQRIGASGKPRCMDCAFVFASAEELRTHQCLPLLRKPPRARSDIWRATADDSQQLSSMGVADLYMPTVAAAPTKSKGVLVSSPMRSLQS